VTSLPALRTERLALRPARADDAPRLRALWDAPPVRRYLFDDEPVDEARAGAVLSDCLALAPRGLGLWTLAPRDAAEPSASGALLGCAALLPVGTAAEYHPPSAGLVEPLISLDPASWGRGYAAEALAALVGHALRPRAEGGLGLPCLAAAADVPNEASLRLLGRLGFRQVAETPGPKYRLRHFLLEAGNRE